MIFHLCGRGMAQLKEYHENIDVYLKLKVRLTTNGDCTSMDAS